MAVIGATLAIVAVPAACVREGPEHNEHLEPILTQAQRARLIQQTQGRDWTAASALTLDVFYNGESNDWQTLEWARRWAAGDPSGAQMLALILSRSCSQNDRAEQFQYCEHIRLAITCVI